MTCRTIAGLELLPERLAPCVLTIGNFDGVHLGHQRILRTCRELAAGRGLPAVALTFDPPPEAILRPLSSQQRLTQSGQKADLLAAAGAEAVVIARTDRPLLEMSAGEFIERIVVGRFHASDVVEGGNFRFGRGREGDVKMLAAAGNRLGVGVHVIDPVMIDLGQGPQRVCSSLIRRLILQGRVEDAAACLGRPFALLGAVVAGQGVGRLIKFPTANLSCGQQIVPADGVYAGRATIGGMQCPAAISIGVKPTLGPSQRTVEAFLIDGKGDHYGRQMQLEFMSRLRDQVKFDSPADLQAQIAKDVDNVRRIVG